MPLFEIRFKAELEGAKSVKMGESYSLRLKLQCGACREASDKYSVVSWEDETDVPGGKGTAHYVQKCKNCGAVANLSIVSTRGDRQFTDEDAEARKSKALATVECRGLVPLEAQAGVRAHDCSSNRYIHHGDACLPPPTLQSIQSSIHSRSAPSFYRVITCSPDGWSPAPAARAGLT